MTKKLIAFLFALILATTSAARADLAEDMQAQIDALQRQLNAVKAQLEQIKAQQAAAAAKPAATPAPGKPVLVKNGTDSTFLIGSEAVQVYGNFDISVDYTTKGLAKYYASSGDGPVGNYGWMPALSTNLSYIGVRGDHQLGPRSGLLYQLETEVDISNEPGTPESNNNSGAIVKGALVSRNSFLGLATPIGAFKLGKTDAPYKDATARMNPFSGEIGDYSVIMGNTGGDNRVEFGTRLDHSVWYESPNWGGITWNALVSPGQNRAYDSSNIAAGEVDCSGGNSPGSGALPPLCNDGSFASAYSTDLTYLNGNKNLYLAVAYELHKKVNRTSDLADLDPNDVADEDALKGGIQYMPARGLTLSGVYESFHRYVPQYLEYQNERQRDGFWLAATQALSPRDNINFGWAKALGTPGDPGQHNTPAIANPDNQSNLYTIAFKHAIDRHVSWYFDWAETLNHSAAHYDLGAGGRAITTDCHDATTLAAFDATANGGAGGVTGAGPHCYAGGQLRGFSGGIDLRF
jgi:predicted porin